MSRTNHENPKHTQGDGAGFGRLRAEQKKRQRVTSVLQSHNPTAVVYVDQIREYCGTLVVFYRAESNGPFKFHHARVAIFQKDANDSWCRSNDIIAAQEDK